MKYTHETWLVTLPDDWNCEESEECMSFYSPDESRSLHVSDYFKDDGAVTLEDIKELAEIKEFEKTNLPFMEGVHHRTIDTDEAVLTWWLYLKNHLLYVEYICPLEAEANLAQEIENIIYSIQSFHGA